jgi:2-dehydro-3-deoxygalactonokinase
MSGQIISIDWGSTNFRAYRLAEDGTVLDRRALPKGILTVLDGDYESVLRAAIGDWLTDMPEAPILLSGMVGGRGGWVEVPYAETPATLAEIARAMERRTLSDGRSLWFIPGLVSGLATDAPDVMRGEEVQIIGAAPLSGSALVCLPGTHSKWARVEDGKMVDFATYLSGEAFNFLCNHSIVGRLIVDAPFNPVAFAEGVRRSGLPGHFLTHSFNVRALCVTGKLAAADIRAMLSGLVIGHEVRAALGGSSADPIILLGEADLCGLYKTALEAIGGNATLGLADAAALGHARVAQALRLGALP